jgi:hypothetical protein
MKTLTALAMALGTILVAGCSTDGISLSEDKMIDNNCSGGGGLVNERWCTEDFNASMGPYADAM